MIKKISKLKINDTAWFGTRVEKKFGVEIENKSKKIWWTVFEKTVGPKGRWSGAYINELMVFMEIIQLLPFVKN